MPSVEIIAVGTELLLGQLVDTNTPYIAQQLADAGIDVYATHAVGDNRARIATAVATALDRADGVITTGGLGPTVDDLTKEGVCDALGLSCATHAPTLARMEAYFASTGKPMRENNRKQAEIPSGGLVLENARGTAPGFIVPRSDGKFVACMPGVPREMKPMLEEMLIPALHERFRRVAGIVTRVLHTTGLGESEIDHRIDDLFRAGENPKIAVLAHVGACDIKIMAKAPSRDAALAMIAPLEEEVARRLHGHVFGIDAQTLPERVLQRARERNWRIAAAESCTGGRIAAALTSVPGASDVLVGGVVAYDNDVKIRCGGVRPAVLEMHGAVSEETVVAMAQGIRKELGAEVGIATTGIAGPSGGTAGKPVGLVWMAASTPAQTRSVAVNFPGDRDEIQVRAAQASLSLLWGILKDEERES